LLRGIKKVLDVRVRTSLENKSVKVKGEKKTVRLSNRSKGPCTWSGGSILISFGRRKGRTESGPRAVLENFKRKQYTKADHGVCRILLADEKKEKEVGDVPLREGALGRRAR